MANRWSGGIVSATPPTPTTTRAPGVWTLAEAAYWQQQWQWPLATPDPNWSSVSFLMSSTATAALQNNTFIDSSTNNFTITRFGNATQGSYSPFQTPPVANPGYSPTTFAGSAYFDGAGDGLTVPNNAALLLGSSNFTLECWVRNDEVVNNCGLAGIWGGSYILYRESTVYKFYYSGPTGSPLTSSIAAVANSWTHLAVVRNGTTLTIYVNGVSGGSVSISTTAFSTSSNVFGIGANFETGSVGFPFKGYMAGLRLVVGTAVYTGAFTPPTTPPTAITNTALLCNFSNANIYDASMRSNLETVGNVQTSATQAKFGPTSVAFDGSGDYLIPSSNDANIFAFGTGAFTIEFWVYFNALSGLQFVYEGRGGTATPTIYTSGTTIYYFANSINAITGSVLATGTWYHVALSRSGTSTRLFVNGTQVGSTYSDSTNYTNTAGRPVIGSEAALASGFLNGYVDELRVTKGVARYTANFTAPTAPFPLF